MAELIFSSWGGKVVDSRKGGVSGDDAVSLPKALSTGTPVNGLMGWDGLAVWGAGVEPIDLARAYAEGLCKNSCGQCVPCRIGSKVVHDALDRICHGKGEARDVETVEHLAGRMRSQAMCDLGQSCGKAFLDFVANFRQELQDAVARKTSIPRGSYRLKVTAPCKSA